MCAITSIRRGDPLDGLLDDVVSRQ